MKTALIVVDMQVDFCPGGLLPVTAGDVIVPRINAMMDDYDAIVLAQDWHPTNHSCFADNHQGIAPYSTVTMSYGPQVMWPRHCVSGTKGAEFHPDLAVARADMILRKGFRPEIDSYSAFYENDHNTSTGLSGYLHERGLMDLTFVGLAFDFCVAWSAIDAAKLGFAATVIRDASRAIDLDGSADRAIGAMTTAGVTLR